MVILFVWDVWKNITEMGRGGACVPARVALQGRIRRSSPAYNASIFGMETPLRGRSGGHAGTAPTASFGWVMMWWKKYNPKGVASSLALLPRVGCVTLANPALSKV